jgi:hypothetical protein
MAFSLQFHILTCPNLSTRPVVATLLAFSSVVRVFKVWSDENGT